MNLKHRSVNSQRPTPVLVEAALARMGNRLKLARKLRGHTQEKLAMLADVSLSTLRALEAGADGVALGNVLKVFQALGLLAQVDQLLDLRADPQAAAFAERKLTGL